MHRLEINIFRVFRPNILWYGQNSRWVNSIFLNGKCLSQFIHKFLKTLGNGISQSSMLSLKCNHPFLCKFSILFSTEKLHVAYEDITFLNSSKDSKFGLQFIKEMRNWDFEKPRLHFQIFTIH